MIVVVESDMKTTEQNVVKAVNENVKTDQRIKKSNKSNCVLLIIITLAVVLTVAIIVGKINS